MDPNVFVIGIVGDKGSGKTLLLAYLLYKDHLTGRSIISNFSLSFEHTQKSFKELSKMPKYLQNATVGYDEFHMAVDSRRSTSKNNIAFTTFLTQLRKKECILIYTTQLFRTLDVRVKDQTDVIITPIENDGEYFTYKVMDRVTGDVINILKLNMKPVMDNKLYNTNEVILFDNEEVKDNE